MTKSNHEPMLPLPVLKAEHAQIYYAVMRKKKILDAEGLKLGPGAALVRKLAEREFTIVLEVDGRLYSVGKVHAACEYVTSNRDKITIFPESPGVRASKLAAERSAARSPEERHVATIELYRASGSGIVSDGY